MKKFKALYYLSSILESNGVTIMPTMMIEIIDMITVV